MSTTWHLRKPDGAIYGPVELDALVQWAADGRITPDDQVSPDGASWQPAPSLPALGMDWVVQLASGELLGPVHLLALREPWQNGQIAHRAMVVRRSNGHSHDAADALATALLAELERAEQHAETLASQVREFAEAAASAPPPAEPATAAPPTAPALRDLHRANDHLEREVQRWKRLYEGDAARHLKHQEEQESLVRTLREELLHARKQVELAQKRARADVAQAPPTSSPDGEAGKPDNASLSDMVRRLTRNYHTMSEQAERTADELEKAQARIAELEGQLQSGIADQRLAAAQAELEAALKRHAELEATHRDILRQFRDLNDRHIRLQTRPGSST